MGRSFVISCALFMVVFVDVPGYKSEAAPPPAKTEVEKLYELAKKEGEINFISSTARMSVAKLFEAFSRKYPGLKLVHVDQTPNEAMPRTLAEARAGRPDTDVVRTGLMENLRYEERDMLAQYDWNRVFGIPKESILADDKVLSYYNQAYPIMYNTNLVAPGDVPKSYEDLLDAKFKGLIGIELRMSHLAYQAAAMGEGRVKDFARKLRTQRPIFIKGSSALADRLVAGEVAIALGSFLYKVLWYQAKGAPIDWARVSPLVLSSEYIVVMKKAPHPNAARLWAGWLVTSEGQQLLEKFEYLSRLGKGSTSRQWKTLQEAKVETWAFPGSREALERNEALKEEFEKIFGTR